jgi:predicted dehydrogenase
VLKSFCGRKNDNHLKGFADQYGWESIEDDWKKVINREDIDIIDICTSNKSHYQIAIQALKAGKHVICEKPLAMNADEAKKMYAEAQKAGVVNMIAFNYRQVPAIIHAKNMIESGKLGMVRHFNAVYYQDWLVDPSFPFVWRNDITEAGSGAHGDMNAHIVDLARYLVGEITFVCGSQNIFVKERPLSDGSGKREVTADDTTSFLCDFENGAQGAFIATRFATGRKNFLRFEIFGSEGSLIFELERLNELQFFSRKDEAGDQGFRTILVTENVHPFIDAWWPPGHIIGWEHTFIHEVKQFLDAIAQNKMVQPNFYDGWKTQQIMDAVADSARNKTWEVIKI